MVVVVLCVVGADVRVVVADALCVAAACRVVVVTSACAVVSAEKEAAASVCAAVSLSAGCNAVSLDDSDADAVNVVRSMAGSTYAGAPVLSEQAAITIAEITSKASAINVFFMFIILSLLYLYNTTL